METKISVIIPVYNTEEYLGNCLTSICTQTLEDLEIICINDASRITLLIYSMILQIRISA